MISSQPVVRPHRTRCSRRSVTWLSSARSTGGADISAGPRRCRAAPRDGRGQTRPMTFFARHWLTYRRVLEHDLMEHRALTAALGAAIDAWLARRGPAAAAPHLVDLGCGDLALLPPLLRRLPLASWTGLDLNPAVLPLAAACPRAGALSLPLPRGGSAGLGRSRTRRRRWRSGAGGSAAQRLRRAPPGGGRQAAFSGGLPAPDRPRWPAALGRCVPSAR